jgi:hypothetical protein
MTTTSSSNGGWNGNNGLVNSHTSTNHNGNDHASSTTGLVEDNSPASATWFSGLDDEGM